MKWSNYFIPTLKEVPKEAESVSHKLMLRGGFIDKVSSGVYTYLPLGYRVLRKVENIIREEMNKSGGIEILMPSLQPSSLWKESGRYGKMGKDMIKFIDRSEREMIFGPTHEEIITDLVRRYVKSWKQLPLLLYQIQTKFRDEIRPRFGIIRAREFLMKDAYSFDIDEVGLDISYEKMKEAYINIFSRCGLKTNIRTADSGVIGGKFSEEFVAEGDLNELEVGHIFKLGTDYSKSMKANFVDRDGKEKPIVMGCYGIGVSRIIAAAIEGSYDERGIIWPMPIAPFKVIIIPLIAQTDVKETSEKIYQEFLNKNIDVLIDDRDETAGVKLTDAELIGIPIMIVLGKKLKEGKVEVRERKEKTYQEVDVENVVEYISDLVKSNCK
ncbi:MAG TPA: proline--tRNA ligase [Candidatus Ratteibacteria bacterium]|nr:proline--tRNA ligase [Candidatus Ratteibacteria bacterium]